MASTYSKLADTSINPVDYEGIASIISDVSLTVGDAGESLKKGIISFADTQKANMEVAKGLVDDEVNNLLNNRINSFSELADARKEGVFTDREKFKEKFGVLADFDKANETFRGRGAAILQRNLNDKLLRQGEQANEGERLLSEVFEGVDPTSNEADKRAAFTSMLDTNNITDPIVIANLQSQFDNAWRTATSLPSDYQTQLNNLATTHANQLQQLDAQNQYDLDLMEKTFKKQEERYTYDEDLSLGDVRKQILEEYGENDEFVEALAEMMGIGGNLSGINLADFMTEHHQKIQTQLQDRLYDSYKTHLQAMKEVGWTDQALEKQGLLKTREDFDDENLPYELMLNVLKGTTAVGLTDDWFKNANKGEIQKLFNQELNDYLSYRMGQMKLGQARQGIAAARTAKVLEQEEEYLVAKKALQKEYADKINAQNLVNAANR